MGFAHFIVPNVKDGIMYHAQKMPRCFAPWGFTDGIVSKMANYKGLWLKSLLFFANILTVTGYYYFIVVIIIVIIIIHTSDNNV